MINKREVHCICVVDSHLYKFNDRYDKENIKLLLFLPSLIFGSFNFLLLSQNLVLLKTKLQLKMFTSFSLTKTKNDQLYNFFYLIKSKNKIVSCLSF
jgi:hypothetical protein